MHLTITLKIDVVTLWIFISLLGSPPLLSFPYVTE